MKFDIILKTARSITVELDNLNPYFNKDFFAVYIDDELIIEKENKNVFSIYNLLPNKQYTLKIVCNEEVSVKEFKTLEEVVTLNVKRFNAKGDGVNDDTIAIQCAIYACPDNGRVFIPKGTYYVRPLFLRSNITVELEKGATLLGNTDRNNYPILPGVTLLTDESDDYNLGSWEGNPLDTFASIITGINVSNVKIIGEGIIDANAHNSDWWIDHRTRRIAFRPKGVYLVRCDNITLQGVTVCNTPSWNLHPYFSSNIRFIDLKIISPKDSPNTDGCDPESCCNVDIIGVDFSVGDDCIAIKAGKVYMGAKYKKPSENFTIRNCAMKFGHGAVTLGSEMSGGIKNITVNRCWFKHTDRGLRIKTRRGRGKDAIIDGITFENILMDEVLSPLVINMYYFCDPDGHTEYVYSKEVHPVDKLTPYMGEFHFKDIIAKNCEVAAGAFWGLPEQPIKKITIENMSFDFKKDCVKGNPAMMDFVEPVSKQGLSFNYVDSVELKNVTMTGQDGDMVILNNVSKYLNK